MRYPLDRSTRLVTGGGSAVMGFALSPTEANFNKPFIEKTLLMIRKRRITPLSGKIICLKARRGGNSSGAARGR